MTLKYSGFRTSIIQKRRKKKCRLLIGRLNIENSVVSDSYEVGEIFLRSFGQVLSLALREEVNPLQESGTVITQLRPILAIA